MESKNKSVFYFEVYLVLLTNIEEIST